MMVARSARPLAPAWERNGLKSSALQIAVEARASKKVCSQAGAREQVSCRNLNNEHRVTIVDLRSAVIYLIQKSLIVNPCS